MQRKLCLIIFDLIILIIALSISVFAWFATASRVVHTDSLFVEMPPILFIRNNEATPDDDMQILNLENLVLGETSYIVFCVVPRQEHLVTQYSLQIAFTSNMNETVNLYHVTSISDLPVTGAVHYGDYYYEYQEIPSAQGPTVDTTTSQAAGVTYQLYTGQTFFTDFQNLTSDDIPEIFLDNLSVVREARFYVLEIDTQGNDPKETDLLYVYVKQE